MVKTLKKELSTTALTFFVVGDILGAGIYSVTGKVAGLASYQTWLSFVCAMVAAGLTGLSYAELGSRYPKAGGESFFSLKAFEDESLSLIVGWLVLFSGVASAATVSHAFAAYVGSCFTFIPVSLLIVGFLITLAVVNYIGINESSKVNIICTTIEATGLLIVILSGTYFILENKEANNLIQTVTIPTQVDSWVGILQGATLAFFSFIGFEDLVNVAEEAKTPEKSLPTAIIIALSITGAFYFFISIIATSVVDPVVLSKSDAPLMLVVNHAFKGFPTTLFIVIGVFAITNTALLNNVMASRLLFGMANQKLVPNKLEHLSPTKKTPTFAIVTVTGLSIVFSLVQDLEFLAQTTSLLILAVFIVINASLFKMKLSPKKYVSKGDYWKCPKYVPLLGVACCAALMAFASKSEFLVFVIVLGVGLVLVAARKLRPN